MSLIPDPRIVKLPAGGIDMDTKQLRLIATVSNSYYELNVLRGFAKYKSTFLLDGRVTDPGILVIHFPKTPR